jgi:hypothetical protein
MEYSEVRDFARKTGTVGNDEMSCVAVCTLGKRGSQTVICANRRLPSISRIAPNSCNPCIPNKGKRVRLS